jgi:hypothetical protein
MRCASAGKRGGNSAGSSYKMLIHITYGMIPEPHSISTVRSAMTGKFGLDSSARVQRFGRLSKWAA